MNAMKSSPQLSLESILKQNTVDASRLRAEAAAKMEENAKIEAEMSAILKSIPPSKLVVDSQGATMPIPTDTFGLSPEKEVLFSALAIVRSWKRRHKKNYNNQETELMKAVERLTWEK